ncbi:unnamed protein product [Brassica rapa subsp. trilocularis]
MILVTQKLVLHKKKKQFMMRKMNQGLLSTPISKIFNSCT